MSVIARIRHTATPSHPYVDTPDFAYDGWLAHLAHARQPLGQVTGAPTVAVIGAGASGLCTAYELAQAGCKVTVFEADAVPGGRCASVPFTNNNPDLAELGAMRFPPSEFTLSFYLQKFGLVGKEGIGGLPDFPDPGVVKTFVCYGSQVSTWLASEGHAPPGFQTVYDGWLAFNEQGITKTVGGKTVTVFQSPQTITRCLLTHQVDLATEYWQEYISAYGQVSFYSFLYDLFTGASGYDIPGGTAWTFDDFDRFGALGIGSGGFGPLYPIGFTDIFRLLPNGLESAQKFLRAGIRSLPEAFAKAVHHDCAFHYQTPIQVVDGDRQRGFTLHSGSASFGPFDRVVMATTTRAMEMTTNLTTSNLVAPAVARAVRRTHVVSSIKIAARIKRFWDPADPADPAVRCLLSDDALHQVYTLDYGAPDTAVCFLSYTWDDDAVKQQALGVSQPGGSVDKKVLYQSLLTILKQIDPRVSEWADHLVPYGDPETSILFVEWQSNPHYNGGFKLSEPGQDPYVQAMFYDFQKAGHEDLDTGVYLGGDCIAWTSGWVEGALQAGLNAATGVIRSLGGKLNGDASGKTPLDLDAARFDYFGAKYR
ncbi:MAG TPA: FAD-dependent oxidoreductase [Telluria sp.]|nr:FAD-dependent oxidoreductase [Telluria sp.]